MLDLTNERDAHVDQRLRSEPIIWLNSVRPDGRPHSVPVWFLWDGTSISIFSQPNNQKIRNLRNNNNVTLTLEALDEGGDVVIIEGKAELLKHSGPALIPPAYEQKYAATMQEMKMQPEQMAAEYSQPIRITPTRFLGWSS